MNSTIEQIDVTKFIEKNDFELLFTSQLDLTPEEIEKINNVYYPTYTTFTANQVPYEEAWVAIRQLFIAQETEIGKRHQNGND